MSGQSSGARQPGSWLAQGFPLVTDPRPKRGAKSSFREWKSTCRETAGVRPPLLASRLRHVHSCQLEKDTETDGCSCPPWITACLTLAPQELT